MKTFNVLNKKNNVLGTAVELESGRFEVTENGNSKEVAASTFKRWYKVESVVEAAPEVEVEVSLTTYEKAVLNGMRNNEYNDAYEGVGTWTFTAIDNSGLEGKVARGAISSLIKKGLVTVNEEDNGYDNSLISFTEAGYKVWSQADGEECSWGGPNLFKVEMGTQLEALLEGAEEVVTPVEPQPEVQPVSEGVTVQEEATRGGKCRKIITTVQYMESTLVITEYNGYVCDVVVTTGDTIYKSTKMSIKDALENGLGLKGDEIKEARKHIVRARKIAKEAIGA